uniref:Uncharacterized protein n=1 Tax=Anguilla anguilla TaxID=7936 RepID=A0A0E9PZS1_ANGAN
MQLFTTRRNIPQQKSAIASENVKIIQQN